MASQIVGALGRKRHGKDTFASRLVTEHGFTRFAFADALREAALKLDPWITIEQDETHLLPWAGGVRNLCRLSQLVSELGWETAKEIREVRRTLQRMGVGVRDLDEDFWVRTVMVAADKHPGPVVITDVRFPNEVTAVTSRAGTTVRVVNPRLPRPDEEHISESALDHYAPRFTIPNTGSIEDLHRHADLIASRMNPAR